MKSIDLNCDLGEGYPNDAELMNYVSSVNVACGFHAGDEETMRRTVDLAISNGLAIGAHPSYPDRENFGRVDMELSGEKLHDVVSEQIFSLDRICKAAGVKLSHVKPHGSLYNRSARDASVAATIAKAVRDFDSQLFLFGLSGSISIIEAEKARLGTSSEVFADRGYRSDGSLVPRSEPHALISDTDAAVDQALMMVTSGSVTAITGEIIGVRADTICIHGDGEHAVEFARNIHDRLLAHNIKVRSVNG